MVEFTHPLAQFAQGVQGGVNLGLQVDQAKRIRDQQEWEQEYKSASMALDVASKDSLHPKMRANAMNNGFIPVWNKRKLGAPLEPMTEADFSGGDLADTWRQVGKVIGDKKTSPEMKMEAMTNIFGDYHVKKGSAKEAQELAFNLVKSKKDDGAGGGSDSPSKIKAEIFRQYLKDPNSLTPQQNSIVAEDLVDPAFKIALTAYGQNLSNLGNKPEEQLAQLKGMAKTIRSAIDEQARTGVATPAASADTASATAPTATSTETPSPKAIADLRAAGGQPLTFGNGQVWVWEGDAPKRIK